MSDGLHSQKLAEGVASMPQPNTPAAVGAGSRCALTSGRDVICTFMVQPASGINDFKPMLKRSRDGGLTWTDDSFI